jgi:hypothetical protein
MPNPNKYTDKNEFMGDCMHVVMKIEGEPHNEAIGKCLGMWSGRDKKKKSASDILREISSNLINASLRSDINKSHRSNKTVVFLGDECPEGDDWRKEIKKEFRDSNFLFLDPYDTSWQADKNIYDELEGLIKSDCVVFFRGGSGTEKEKSFLDNLGKTNYKSFKDLEDLKGYLKNEDSKGKSISAGYAKTSFPHFKGLDLHFESMDKDSVEDLKEDIIKGESITISPDIRNNYDTYALKDFKGKDVLEELDNNLGLQSAFMNPIPSTGQKNKPLYYDKNHHEIRIKTAKKGELYDYSSTQVDLPGDLSKDVISWGKKIPEGEIYTDEDGGCGREDEIHVTLLYGLTGADPEGVNGILKSVKPFEITLGKITSFSEPEDYDVLKIDVDSPELHRLHYLMEKELPNENKYPQYKPHVTIAYLKKGAAEKYVGDDTFNGKKFKADSVIFSPKDKGKKMSIKLTDTARLVESLDNISNRLEEKGLTKEAFQLDVVANSLEAPKYSNIVYDGIFFDFNDPSLEKNGGEYLSKVVKDPHVTFAFKPTKDKLIPESLLGQEYSVTVIGLGNDGDNHGYEVELPQDLKRYYFGAPVPHITLSTSDTGKAVNTKDLKFEKINPFTIKGKLGYFTNNGVVFE